MQIFVGQGEVETDRLDLMLYLARKRAENAIRNENLAGNEMFYVCSLSSRTILYKGMLLSEQLNTFYPELEDERLVSAIAFVHQRYSTNTFPTWDLAQPFRYIAHNGEINTLRGNINRMRARTALFAHLDLADAITDLDPVIIEGSSDTACLDNALEMLVVTGRSLAHSLAMMVPEAWASKAHLRPDVKGFFEYHATMMEPWDGPANIVACDGKQVVAILDRNGLRPARYWITSDDEIIYASEAGVLDIPPEKILRKERLAPGKMILVDVETGEFKEDHEIKGELAAAHPYGAWVRDYLIRLEDLPAPATKRVRSHGVRRRKQGSFGYTLEEMREIMAPMAINGQEPVGSMGTDTPVAVLSKHSKLLYWYFNQLFAQITNPPIDPLREEIVMSLTQYLGPARNILMPGPEHCQMLELDHPVITNDVLEQLRHSDIEGFRGTTLSTLFDADSGSRGHGTAPGGTLFVEAEAAVDAGRTILVLSDRGVCDEKAPIPALLALSANHHSPDPGRQAQPVLHSSLKPVKRAKSTTSPCCSVMVLRRSTPSLPSRSYRTWSTMGCCQARMATNRPTKRPTSSITTPRTTSKRSARACLRSSPKWGSAPCRATAVRRSLKSSVWIRISPINIFPVPPAASAARDCRRSPPRA